MYFMSKFDSMMTKRLSELLLKTNLLIKYMDDIRKLLQAIKSGTVYKDGKLGYCREKDILDRNKSDERITADLLLEIMNELLPGIKFTAEIGEEFPGDWGLPTLGTVVRVSNDVPRPSLVSRKIKYRYYRKPMATKLVTDFNSAHPMNSKIATLSQEVYRHLSNCSPDTDMTEKSTILESLIDRLR